MPYTGTGFPKSAIGYLIPIGWIFLVISGLAFFGFSFGESDWGFVLGDYGVRRPALSEAETVIAERIDRAANVLASASVLAISILIIGFGAVIRQLEFNRATMLYCADQNEKTLQEVSVKTGAPLP